MVKLSFKQEFDTKLLKIGVNDEWVKTSVTRLGDFWQFFATFVLSKVAQIFMGSLENNHFWIKTSFFWATVGKLGTF